mgnify:FL=1|tara:strand:+ start:81 stop:269 length:189 start_codon:yes stop_codon:yes gene_type:complete
MDEEELENLLAMVFYDDGTKSVFINITGFRNNIHGKTISDWVLNKLHIEQIDIPYEDKPTVH